MTGTPRHRGRHRLETSRRRRTLRVATATALLGSASVLLTSWPTAADAAAPVRTGWWSAAAGPTVAAPAPTTPDGDLQVTVVPGQVTAYAAVLYHLPRGASATLELAVDRLADTPQVEPSTTITPAVAVQACPTRNAHWAAGGDQPMAKAPAYDCRHSFQGSLSADQKTLTFLVDGSADIAPGVLSLAVVPVRTSTIPVADTQAPVDTTQPFALTIAKPKVASLTVTMTAPAPPPPPAQPPAPPAAGTGAAGTTGATTSAAGTVPDVSLPAGATGTQPDSGQVPAPVIAPSAPPGSATTGAVPVAAVKPLLGTTGRNTALALLMLLAVAVLATGDWGTGRAPQRLGGLARRSGDVAPAYGVRGLGRFNKPRNAKPRPLF